MRLVRWPDDAEHRAVLAADGIPRLLLVDAGIPPPHVTEDIEDWVRTPVDELDLWARLRNLELRARGITFTSIDDKAFLERLQPIWRKIARDLKAEDLLDEIIKAGQ